MSLELILERAEPILQIATSKLFQWRRRAATLALCFLAVWLAYHVIFGANGTMVYSHKIAEHRALDKEILELKQENEQLNHQVKALKNDPETIEKEAREQLRYARPGEVIYTLPQQRALSSTITAQRR